MPAPRSTSSSLAGRPEPAAARQVDVLLGHPLDDVFGALVVAINGVVADQLEVDVPVADRHARVVAKRVAGLAHRGDEPCAGAEVGNQIAGMQSLGQLAPVGQVGSGDLLALEHVHGRGVCHERSIQPLPHRFGSAVAASRAAGGGSGLAATTCSPFQHVHGRGVLPRAALAAANVPGDRPGAVHLTEDSRAPRRADQAASRGLTASRSPRTAAGDDRDRLVDR